MPALYLASSLVWYIIFLGVSLSAKQMDCDKEEAERAEGKAEEAKKMVLKAQRLYSSLPGLPQMFAAFNVHTAATAKDNYGRTNWHDVLDVDPSDDIKTIKKQYEKLRLLTHPDKNCSAAAGGASKLSYLNQMLGPIHE